MDAQFNWNKYFYGPDFVGFEAVAARMKDGKHGVQGLADYMKQMAKAHEEFGKKLQTIAKQEYGFKSDTGTLSTAWEALNLNVEQQAQTHLQAASEMEKCVVKPLNEFIKKEREEVKAMEDNIKKHQHAKKQASDKVLKAHISYDQKVKEQTQALEKATLAPIGKEKEKLQKASMKKQDEVKKADAALIAAITACIQTTTTWRGETTKFYQEMLEREAQRYTRVRDDAWKILNVVAMSCCAVDTAVEQTRLSFEAISFEQDMIQLCREKGTGPDIPLHPPIVYSHDNGRHAEAANQSTINLSMTPASSSTTKRRSSNNQESINSNTSSKDSNSNSINHAGDDQSTDSNSTAAPNVHQQQQQQAAGYDDSQVYNDDSAVYKMMDSVGVVVPTLVNNSNNNNNNNSIDEGDKQMYLQPNVLHNQNGASNVTAEENNTYEILTRKKQPITEPKEEANIYAQLPRGATEQPPAHDGFGMVVATFHYPRQGDEEITLTKGDVITVLEKENEVWWKGQLGSGGPIGMFPVAYTDAATT